MDVKERLVEIIQNSVGGCARHWAEVIADGLLANGVAVHEWISVEDRLPDTQEYDWVLAQITFKPECIYGVPVVAELRADGWYDVYDNIIDGKYEKVTHWMPLPHPPKGE